MTDASPTLRSCPTRSDGAEVLIAHSIPLSACHERQRRLYHKCYTCVHRGEPARRSDRAQARLPDLDAAVRR